METSDKLSARLKKRSGLFGTTLRVLLTGVCYYVATEIAWALCFPDSKVSLLFPPHAVLVAILLLVPTRHWWAYTLASICGHFVATRPAIRGAADGKCSRPKVLVISILSTPIKEP